MDGRDFPKSRGKPQTPTFVCFQRKERRYTTIVKGESDGVSQGVRRVFLRFRGVSVQHGTRTPYTHTRVGRGNVKHERLQGDSWDLGRVKKKKKKMRIRKEGFFGKDS